MSEQQQQQEANRKQTDAGAGASASQDFRQRHAQRTPQTSQTPSPLPPLNPQELTAEWTVRAQLTFARPGEQLQREFSSNDTIQPVRVVYKWSTLDSNSTGTAASNMDADEVVGVVYDEDNATTSTLRSHKHTPPSSNRCSRQTTPAKSPRFHHAAQQPAGSNPQQSSFHSTSSSVNADNGGADSAFSSSNASKSKQSAAHPSGSGSATATLYGTRCRSTCNIIVSAVADFLPAAAMTAASAASEHDNYMSAHATTSREFIPADVSDPFVFNTTASYTVLPDKPPKNINSYGKMLASRDACSQTSDTETKYWKEQQLLSSYASCRSPTADRHLHRPYDHRRATSDAVLTPHSAMDPEGNTFMPSFTPSPAQTFKSSSLPRIPPLPGQQYSNKPAPTEPQKKPRTVHIDVYCTGSEDENENADGESSSSSDSERDGSKQHDLDSNSTPQTVLDNEQMLLRHQRIAGRTLPRRLAPQQQVTTKPIQRQQHVPTQPTHSQDSGLNLGHGITKSSTAEEVTESKQLLFRKHIGDQRAAKLANLRQKYIRQASDDALSSNYPNSSRSTVRDATCSSISSAVPSTHTGDYADSSWKETEDFDDAQGVYQLNKSESFEYENALDRLRIRQMENVWSRGGDTVDAPIMHGDAQRPHSPTPFHMLQTISEDSSQRDSPLRGPQQFQRNDTLPSESDIFYESDHYHTYPGRQVGALPHFQQGTPPNATQLQQTSHFPRNRPGFLQFFGPNALQLPQAQELPAVNISSPPATAPAEVSNENPVQFSNYQPHLQRWKSEARENLTNNGAQQPAQHLEPSYPPTLLRCGSEAPPSTTKESALQSPMVARRFDVKLASPSPSDTSTAISGYTTEYLEKARKFGKVVTARKPGHHVGPTKNPNCSCDSCQRWMAERFQLRGRAFSLGERPVLKRAL